MPVHEKGTGHRTCVRAKAPVAVPLYEKLIAQLEQGLGKKIATGEFGGDMQGGAGK
jgi:D-tyrosyl-tRNA(Tyr) deacylase